MRGSRTVTAVAMASVLAGTAACGSDNRALTFVSTGSSFQDNQKTAWQEPFTAESGIEVRNDGPVDEAKLRAMVDAGKVSWDVVDTSAAAAEQYCGTYLEPLDFSIVDRDAYPPETVSECGVPAYFYSIIFMYDTTKYGDRPPRTIADFFDPERYPGRRMVPPEIAVGLLEDALLADGAHPDQLYPLDVDRALRKVDVIKDVTTFAETYGQMQQAMVDGQVDMALVSTARAHQALSAGAPFEPVWDKTIVNWNDLVVPKGSPNREEAMKFIAFIAGDEPSARFSELASVQPVNEQVKPNFDEVQRRIDAFSPEHRHSVVLGNARWWARNFDAVTEKFTAWLAG
ncbi:ABC transporter substrate-binding protein [Amycolatopsis cihanbeyliensis]|uniref:Putative spermidine/putrescine transport system substrate-binding protein n=1 Tax=Amycolatopsis cihanbeyliensis TaxID=1128664 RepID=A0A542DFX4_AMYCI|nr:ABC transporter substrate-binding protein [Amycolatopsis cihanbeyliensis]TQJ01983.1 putative spermidine/putrescine transport system substrate-binding protein [Amycolatopsis cihanbeyliensis]